MFAPEGLEHQRTREVVELYSSITDEISKRMEFTLYFLLNAMIDANFDDEDEYQEMISMLQSNTSQKAMEEFESLNIAKNTISILKKANADAFDRIDNLKRVNAEAHARINHLNEVKEDLNRIIVELQSEIEELNH